MDLFLREVIPTDLPVFFAQQADPESTRMAAMPARDREAFDAHWRKILADDSTRIRTIVAEGLVVGHVLSFVRDGGRQVGYWISREHWGRGIASAALAMFLRSVPERPLHAHAARHNLGSIRVLEKCGFRITAENDGWNNGWDDGIPECILSLDAREPLE